MAIVRIQVPRKRNKQMKSRWGTLMFDPQGICEHEIPEEDFSILASFRWKFGKIEDTDIPAPRYQSASMPAHLAAPTNGGQSSMPANAEGLMKLANESYRRRLRRRAQRPGRQSPRAPDSPRRMSTHLDWRR